LYHLTIVTPEKIFYEDEVSSIIAPGSEGYLGVLTDHAPLITALAPGKLILRDKKNKEKGFALAGGFLEVYKNKVTILADSAEFPEQIDLERAQSALERAKKRLKSASPGIDVNRASQAMLRALNRIKIYDSYIKRL
jgi:F-type H+-transporting ATPase subunit epsilon